MYISSLPFTYKPFQCSNFLMTDERRRPKAKDPKFGDFSLPRLLPYQLSIRTLRTRTPQLSSREASHLDKNFGPKNLQF